MKNTIKAILFALVSSISLLQAGEPALPRVAAYQPTVKVNAFAASLLNEDADATYGGGVSLETVSIYNVGLRASLVSLEDETFTLGASILYTVPVNQTFAVYALAGVDYEVDQAFWSTSLGGGATVALSQRVNLFVETSYGFALDSDNQDKAWGVSAGVGVKF
jgi:hypothetical protein